MMTDTAQALKIYLDFLHRHPNEDEIFYRTPFETLINAVQFPAYKTTAYQEPRNTGIDVDGMPDFFVYRDDTTLFKSLVGFIECKKPLFKLEKLLESEQIKKYAKTTENIIITNYGRFILLQKNAANGKLEPVHDFTLVNIDNPAVTKFENLLLDFYDYQYQFIKTKKTLVNALAAQSFYYSVALREFVNNIENANENFYKKFNRLRSEFDKAVNYYYTIEDFCDIYSQSFVYGLLLAKLETQEGLNEKELLDDIPQEYDLLQEFLAQPFDKRHLPVSIRVALTNIVKNTNLINSEAIEKEFANSRDGKQNIAVYLYEDFLQQYDKHRGTENRKQSGVYYTPKEAANFIARSVNEIIKTKFNLPNGYNSKNIKVLDFACGTGTFLHSVLEQMLMPDMDELQKKLTADKIIADIYGFELLFAPYIVAQKTLSLFLKKRGIHLSRRLSIFLNNTLDISQRSISDNYPELQKEIDKSFEIKNAEDILAIVGNPPYFNGKSRERKGAIDDELKVYKKGLNEKKIGLDDSYIKFIRFAEWKINKCKQGIVGIITNNSFLDGITHRQMRKHLHETFDEIYILNLHGNTRKGDADKNIFDIMVGVQICFFVKLPKPLKNKKTYYFSTLENNLISRAEKLSFLENTNYKNINWKELKPAETPYYWFVEKDFSYQKEYEKFWNITDIFKAIGSGIKTDRDELLINYNKKILSKNLEKAFSWEFEKDFAKRYKIQNSTSYAFADKLKQQSFDKQSITNVQYRPFDNRFIYYKIGFTSRPANEITKHFEKENFGICFTRNTDRNRFLDVLITDKFVDIHFTSGQTYIAPLYFYNGVEHKDMLPLEFEGEGIKYANFTEDFIKNYLDKLDFETTPESVLAYIYAVLHSPIYRKKYIEFLKTDFPAVPMTTDKAVFEKYSALGQKLVDYHLLAPPQPSPQGREADCEIRVNGDITENDFVIEKVEHNFNKLIITKTDNKCIVFEGVTNEIYNFEIGSYKPIEKWLKYRIKDKVPLSVNDLEHLQKIIIALKNTISTMKELEGWGEEYIENLSMQS